MKLLDDPEAERGVTDFMGGSISHFSFACVSLPGGNQRGEFRSLEESSTVSNITVTGEKVSVGGGDSGRGWVASGINSIADTSSGVEMRGDAVGRIPSPIGEEASGEWFEKSL